MLGLAAALILLLVIALWLLAGAAYKSLIARHMASTGATPNPAAGVGARARPAPDTRGGASQADTVAALAAAAECKKAGDYEGAVAHLQRALPGLTGGEERATALVDLAVCLNQCGRQEQVIRYAAEALELRPKDKIARTAHRMTSVAHITQGRREDAERHTRIALEIATRSGDREGSADVLAGLGAIAIRRGDLRGAFDYVTRSAATCDRPRREAVMVLATLHRYRGEFDLARRAIERYATAEPRTTGSHAHRFSALGSRARALIAIAAEEPEDAVRFALEAVEGEALGPRQRLTAEMALTHALSMAERHDEAGERIERMESAAAAFSEDREITLGLHGARGRAAYYRLDWSAAEKHFRRYIDTPCDPVDAPAMWWYIGECRRKLGDTAGAEEAYRMAVAPGIRTRRARQAAACLAESYGDPSALQEFEASEQSFDSQAEAHGASTERTPEMNEEEKAVVELLGYDPGVVERVRVATGGAVVALQQFDGSEEGPVGLLFRAVGNAKSHVEAIQAQLSGSGYVAFHTRDREPNGLSRGHVIGLVRADDPIDAVERLGTNGYNYGVDPQQVAERLRDWNRRYGIRILGASHDYVDLTLQRVPEDLGAFAAEVYDFCPDTVEQSGMPQEFEIDDAERAELLAICPELPPDPSASEPPPATVEEAFGRHADKVWERMGANRLPGWDAEEERKKFLGRMQDFPEQMRELMDGPWMQQIPEHLRQQVREKMEGTLAQLGDPAVIGRRNDTGIRMLAREIRNSRRLFLWWD